MNRIVEHDNYVYVPECSCLSCVSVRNGPLSMSEADLAALETQGRDLVEAGKRIHQHLSHCEYSDHKTLYGFFDILKYVGIYDEVVSPKPITQPQAEMACHHEE